MKTKLIDIAEIIRSKNAGPYELTFDIIFKTFEDYERVCAAHAINADLVCALYGIPPSDVIAIVEFAPAKAIKATIVRPRCSGDPGETDVYGAQQHAPWLDVELAL